MPAKEKIILALDMNDRARALDTVDLFSGHINTFKVGLELFTSAGPSVVQAIQDKGKKVFLDLKFHDIPNTMARAAVEATGLGVFMFNVHVSAGTEALRKCSETVTALCLKENLNRPRILGVTVLTSMGQETLHNEFGIQHSLRTHVKHLAVLAADSGLDGVVASAHEVSMIKHHCPDKFLIVTPGIRPSWSPPDDQHRTMTPKEAIREGSDYLVIGRSIMNQPDPLAALDMISLEILTA